MSVVLESTVTAKYAGNSTTFYNPYRLTSNLSEIFKSSLLPQVPVYQSNIVKNI